MGGGGLVLRGVGVSPALDRTTPQKGKVIDFPPPHPLPGRKHTGTMVNGQAVRIRLECNLVCSCIYKLSILQCEDICHLMYMLRYGVITLDVSGIRIEKKRLD